MSPVFLVSRIREYWVRCGAARRAPSHTGAEGSATPGTGRTTADNDESVACGLARTARVITAAALVMSISFAALIPAHVQFMRMFGIGLTLAVLVDATLVRMVLVPAFMHVLGRWNWGARTACSAAPTDRDERRRDGRRPPDRPESAEAGEELCGEAERRNAMGKHGASGHARREG
jgi:RND superfamily putative drug exporter